RRCAARAPDRSIHAGSWPRPAPPPRAEAPRTGRREAARIRTAGGRGREAWAVLQGRRVHPAPALGPLPVPGVTLPAGTGDVHPDLTPGTRWLNSPGARVGAPRPWPSHEELPP